MSYQIEEAGRVKEFLSELINNIISAHPDVKAAIKARKAVVVEAANPATHTVTVRFPMDTTNLVLPYNPNISTTALAVGQIVSVWYSQTLQNAIVMQNGSWTL